MTLLSPITITKLVPLPLKNSLQPQSYLVVSTQTMNLIRPKLSRLFYDSGQKKTLPDCGIQVVPWYHSEAVFQSYRESKGVNCKAPSLQMLPFFVDNFGPTYTEWTTSAHEQLPGHHLEVIILKQSFWQKLLYVKLRERETKSRAVMGYPCGQDGAILPARDYPPCPARKISPVLYWQSFSGQDG